MRETMTPEAIKAHIVKDPGSAYCTVTTKELRGLLLDSDTVVARGRVCRIVSEHIGAGVHRVALDWPFGEEALFGKSRKP